MNTYNSNGVQNQTVYPVAELFTSINGEGQFSGELAVFIRMRGCNLSCVYCDTQWANGADANCQWMSLDEIVHYTKETGIKRVTLTGGEPLTTPKIDLLIEKLLESGLSVEIETNGSISIGRIKKQFEGKKLYFTVDYKLPGSEMEAFMIQENYTVIDEHDVVKFVLVDQVDFNRAIECIRDYDMEERTQIYFSVAFGALSLQALVEALKAQTLNHVKVQLQMHKYIWGASVKGV